MPSNRIKKFQSPSIGIISINRINEQRFFSKIIRKDGYSQVLELSITFINSFENIRYEHYPKQPVQSIEIKLNQFLHKNTKLIEKLKHHNSSHPLIREFTKETIDEKIFANTINMFQTMLYYHISLQKISCLDCLYSSDNMITFW